MASHSHKELTTKTIGKNYYVIHPMALMERSENLKCI